MVRVIPGKRITRGLFEGEWGEAAIQVFGEWLIAVCSLDVERGVSRIHLHDDINRRASLTSPS